MDNGVKRVAAYFETYDADISSVLFIHKDVHLSDRALQQRWREHGYTPGNCSRLAEKTIREKLKKICVEAKVYWKDYAETQLRECELRKTNISDWLSQFNRLGISHIARRLLMRIRVIRFDNEKNPFGLKEHETLGQKIWFAFVPDEDPGGSWVSIQHFLTSHHRPEKVCKIEWDSGAGRISLPISDAEELVICEDGLWSGRETNKRLVALRSALTETGFAGKLRLKFAVVTDFGLKIVRHKIRELGLGAVVQIDAHDAELVRFLSPGLDDNNGDGLSTDQYFQLLQTHVVPAAFGAGEEWPEGIESAIETCRTIGEQLVRNWFQDEHPGKDAGHAAEKFALGGGGFASTIFFRKSVPKVCLPLLWLDGEVVVGGKAVQWRPLLVDSRRIRDEELLWD